MSACSRVSRKRKHEDMTQDNDAQPVDSTSCHDQKKRKLNLQVDGGDDASSFHIELAKQTTVQLFASRTINNNKKSEHANSKDEDDDDDDDQEEEEEEESKHECLCSMRIGRTHWKFEFYQLPTDATDDIYRFLDLLFEEKLCDWKEYIQPTSASASCSSNNFVSIIKDSLGVWRAAILFIVYELHFAPQSKQEKSHKYVIKIPLAGVDLHFRRQNVGSLLIQYTVCMIHQIMQQQSDKYEILVLVIDELQAKSFWMRNEFVIATECKQLEYGHIFEKELMLKTGFLRTIEEDLLLMVYAGQKSMDLVLNNEKIEKFETPKYVNFNQRYCKKHEIAETEKAIKEWERKKQELDEKQKQKEAAKSAANDGQEEEEEEEDEFGSDEDFDLQQALEQQSSDEEEEDYDDDDEDDDDYDGQLANIHNKNR